mgnify:CR=1 FL=1
MIVDRDNTREKLKYKLENKLEQSSKIYKITQ